MNQFLVCGPNGDLPQFVEPSSGGGVIPKRKVRNERCDDAPGRRAIVRERAGLVLMGSDRPPE